MEMRVEVTKEVSIDMLGLSMEELTYLESALKQYRQVMPDGAHNVLGYSLERQITSALEKGRA